MKKPSRLYWLILALILLAMLTVMVDENCSRDVDKWQSEFGEMGSEKASDGD